MLIHGCMRGMRSVFLVPWAIMESKFPGGTARRLRSCLTTLEVYGTIGEIGGRSRALRGQAHAVDDIPWYSSRISRTDEYAGDNPRRADFSISESCP